MLHSISKVAKTFRPPYLSVSIPKGNLIIAPERMGIPNSYPVFITDQLKISLSTK